MSQSSEQILVHVEPEESKAFTGVVTRAGRSAVQVDFHGKKVPRLCLHTELEARFEGGPLAFDLQTEARITGKARLERSMRYRFSLEPTATRLLTAAFRVRKTFRAQPEQGAAVPIEVLPPDGGPALEATLNDLSVGGLSFYSERVDADRLAAHEELHVRLHLPGQASVLDLELQVRSLQAQSDLVRVGGALRDARQGVEAERQIAEWVRARLSGA